ncbi:MAG: sensor domain-containing diguanylate cyclase [Vicinamibacterales bacterium]|nr:sensor domain-containing diguanylate cyclase [Vicinamibacterales bacterium]
MPADRGIVGHTYRSGQAYLASRTKGDPHFDQTFDDQLGFETESVLSVPIQVGRSTCGVLQLVNHRDRESFIEEELKLLSLFAGFISTSLQNVLDANRAQELAKRDDLTGLYNDRYFNQQLNDEIERADRDALELCVIFLDLDHFKEVNDQYGHLVGSQTLAHVGRLLAEVVPPEAGTVARYGGDEFVLILPSADLRRGLEIAETIRNRIEATVFSIDRGLDQGATLEIGDRITASIGVASYRAMADTDDGPPSHGDRLIRSADQAMYRAKALGKNRVCHPGGDAPAS